MADQSTYSRLNRNSAGEYYIIIRYGDKIDYDDSKVTINENNTPELFSWLNQLGTGTTSYFCNTGPDLVWRCRIFNPGRHGSHIFFFHHLRHAILFMLRWG